MKRPVGSDVEDPAPDHVALDVRNFGVSYDEVEVVKATDLQVRKGRVFGLVGESGSGKSSLALGLLGLLPHQGRVTSGAALIGDVDLRRLGRAGLTKIRGRDIAFIPQAAMSLLDPTMNVLAQVEESASLVADPKTASTQAKAMLERVGISDDRHNSFPHQLSGGQRQRVVIAMAVANQPKLLIADEPTTGLDVVTQREILDLIDELRSELGLEVLVISHDLPLIAARAHDLAIMYAGRIIETGPTAEILARPDHPYTHMLSNAFGSIDGPRRNPKPIPGEPPDPALPISGCAFAPRCPVVEAVCREKRPELLELAGRNVACHIAHSATAAMDPA